MADSGYDIIYPPRGRIAFDGGLNTKFERSEIADNETPDCFNVVFGNAAAETRGGISKLNTTAIGSYVGDGLYTRRANNGAETMIAWVNGTAFQLAATTFSTIPSAQSVFTAGIRVGATQYENHIFFGNGGVAPYKYNGTDFTRHGVPQATGAVSVASAATSTGSLNGTYRYRIAYVNSQTVIGDVGTATVDVTLTNGKAILTSIPVAPQSHGVNARKIYRNFASGTTALYGLLTTISDNTTTTYVDNALDDTLGASYASDQGEPPKYSVIAQHQNRLFCNDTSNPNYLWYSDLYEPYTFASTNFLPVGDASQDLLKGIDVYENSVVLSCEISTYIVVMPSTDPTEWAVIKTKSPYGTRSPFSSILYNNRLLWGAQQNGKFVGFAALAGTTLDPDATILDNSKAGSDLKSNRIEQNMFDVVEAYLGNMSAIVFKNRAYIALTSGSGNTVNNRIFVYDFSIASLGDKQEASWSVYSGPAACQFAIYNGNLYFLDASATGFVRCLETTSYSDDSSAINSYLWTKEFSGLPGHENLQKDFRKAYLLVEKSGSYYMSFGYRVNSDNGQGVTKQIDLSNGADVWGDKNWGTMVWGSGSSQEEIEIPLGASYGKRIQFKFSNQNTAGQKFKVVGMKFKYNLKGKR